jgi:CheY-like chemotaxis protein
MTPDRATITQLPLPPNLDRRPVAIRAVPRRLRVLLALVPDEANGWCAHLMSARHDVVAVFDSEAALDALADDAFDVLLMDLALPEAFKTAKLYRFLSLDQQPVPVVGLTISERNERYDGLLSKCLPLHAGSEALAALESMFSGRLQEIPHQGDLSQVVSIDVYRALRARRE